MVVRTFRFLKRDLSVFDVIDEFGLGEEGLFACLHIFEGDFVLFVFFRADDGYVRDLAFVS